MLDVFCGEIQHSGLVRDNKLYALGLNCTKAMQLGRVKTSCIQYNMLLLQAILSSWSIFNGCMPSKLNAKVACKTPLLACFWLSLTPRQLSGQACIQDILSSRAALGLPAECVARAKVSCIQRPSARDNRVYCMKNKRYFHVRR